MLSVFPLPFYEYYVKTIDKTNTRVENYYIYYLLSDYMFAIMFLRLFFIFRTLLNQSIYRDENAKKICKFHGVSSNVMFTFKCIYKTYPTQTIIYLFLLTIIVIII